MAALLSVKPLRAGVKKIFRSAAVAILFVFVACDLTVNPEKTKSLPAPAAPSVIRGDGRLGLSWAAGEEGAVYELWTGTSDDSGGAVKYREGISGTSAEITGLSNGTPCYIWLRAKNREAESGFSPPAVERPEAPKTPPEGFIYVPGGTINGLDSFAMTVTIPPGYSGAGTSSLRKGAFVQGRSVAVDSLFWSRYETTYERWYEVREWAENNGYHFQNKGLEGRTGAARPSPSSAGVPPGANREHPVTAISWRDALVWCNAYSEMNAREPVYSYGGAVIRDSRDAAACDGAVMDKAKNGCRLPTEAEREFAARGGAPAAADWMYLYAGSNNIEETGWHHGNSPFRTHPAGEKRPNRLGLYDLSGNVQEWCWDWMNYGVDIGPDTPPDGAARDALVKGTNGGNQKPFNGGGVGSNPAYAAVTFRWGYSSNHTDLAVGFRVVCKGEGL